MTRLRRLLSVVRWIVGRTRAERDLRDELESFVDMAAADRRRDGLAAAEARRQALLHLGGVEQATERVRAGRHGGRLDEVARDVRHGLRQMRRTPALSAIAIATLAVGIGANSAIFSVVSAVNLRPLPYQEPERLVSAGTMLGGEYLFLRDRAKTIEAAALFRANVGLNLTGSGEAERVTGAVVSANFFSMLGVSAVVGRTFHPADEQRGDPPVVVLSDGFWRRRFASDAHIIGRDVLIDGEARRVVGVMPATFHFPSPRTEVWIPFAFDARDAAALWGGGQRGRMVARLAPHATAGQAERELRALAPELRRVNTLWTVPPTWGSDRAIAPLQDQLVQPVRTRLLVLLGAVGIVLLVACANVANLLLARGSSRQREFTIRRALGAARGRIVRQLLTESVLLGLCGGAAGLALAFLGVPLLVSGMPMEIPRVEEIRVDYSILGFTLGLGWLTGVVFGALPAIRLSRQKSPGSLWLDDRGSGSGFGRAASVLVVAEMAVAVLLVIGAGLLIRSFTELVRVDPGFGSEQITAARITLPDMRYSDSARQQRFYDELLTRLRALPGVQAAEATSHLPLVGGGSGFAFEVEGKPYVKGTAAPMTAEHSVTPGYLQTMGISVLRGRPLAASDEPSFEVAVINDTMARRHWPGQDPVGQRLKRVWNNDWITVVGVVNDVKYDGLASEAEPQIYRPFVQSIVRDMSVVVRTASDQPMLAARLRDTLASLDRTVAVSDIQTIDQLLATSVAPSRFTALLLTAFAAIALTLAAIGTYGVLSYAVSRRTREIGVRMALGARRVDVLRMVLGHAAWLAGAGAVAGVLAAFATTPILEDLLFGVSRTDAVTFAAVPILLGAVALLAAYVPASRATRVDPTTALRLE